MRKDAHIIRLISLCLLVIVLTSESVSAAPSGVLLSFRFSLGYPGGGGARCRVLTVPKSSDAPKSPDGYWNDLLCGQNGYKDTAGNTIEQLTGYFPQFDLNANATYNEGTGVLTITYDDGLTDTVRFNAYDEMGP